MFQRLMKIFISYLPEVYNVGVTTVVLIVILHDIAIASEEKSMGPFRNR